MARKINWSTKDDNILAETVLNCIQNGKTQLIAFEEAAEKLNRTAAACGFRWNSTVRKYNEEQLKKYKKNRKITSSMVPIHDQVDGIKGSLVDVFNYIKELEQKVEHQQKEIGELN